MAGPAEKLWQQALPDLALLGSIEEVLDGAGCLLSGTGWATDIEHNARVMADTAGMPSIATLDHWVNYSSRFFRNGSTQWPDALVVADGWAKRLAGEQFPKMPIWQWPNRYLEHQLVNIGPPSSDGDILYIGEPARDDWGRGRPGEFQAIEYFVEKIRSMENYASKRIRFRPHPSENAEKYDAIIKSVDYAALDESVSLSESINRAIMVGGMGSAAMVVALAAGRVVYSSMPPWAPPCHLPHDGIIHLREMDRP